MRVQVRAGDRVLNRYQDAIQQLGERKANQAFARALNRTGNPAATAVKRALVRQTSAPRVLVEQAVQVSRAFGGNRTDAAKMEFRITARGRPIPLKEFKPRQFSFGVRAKVWGRFQRFPGMFGAPGDNPAIVGRLGGHVYVRTSRARLPIERTYGPAIPTELVKGESADTFKGQVFRLADDVAHELGRVLPK